MIAPGGVLRDPENIGAAGHRRVVVIGGSGTRVFPMMRFGMAIGETDVTALTVVHRRQINHRPGRRLRLIKFSVGRKSCVIDGISAFLGVHEHVRWRRQTDFR